MAINDLKTAHLLVGSAWAIHAISWFLPVVTLGELRGFVGPVRGWYAVRFALSPIWPGDFGAFDAWYVSVLSVASAATTFLLIVGSPLVVWRGSLSVRKACAWVAIAAFIVNSHWYILSGPDRRVLNVGYFLWWLSFGLLAGGMFRLSSNGSASHHRQAIPNEAIC